MNTNNSFFDDLQTTQRLVLSSVANAVLIEQQFGEFLLPPPEGVYKNGEVDPCMISTEPYYYESEHGNYYPQKGFMPSNGISLQPVANINTVKTNVYDKTGKIIIPAYMMNDKEKYLSSTPTVPYRGVILAELLIRNYLDSVSSIPGKRSYAGRIEKHIKTEFLNSQVVDTLEAICNSLFLHLEQFIGQDLWHIYYVKRSQFDIIIEKTIDYRIYYYNMKHKQESDDSS